MNFSKKTKYFFRASLALGITLIFISFQNFTFIGTELGSDNSVVVAKGQVMGSCMYQMNSSFAVTTAPTQDSIVWPMKTCDSAGNAVCDVGFQMINDTPVQMNCSTSPSTQLENCYWGTKRCVSTAGSIKASDFVRGQAYGGCLAQLNEGFQVTGVQGLSWPMLKCDNSGQTQCEPGFKAIKETPVQMNCSNNPSKTNALNCYWMTTRCVKL
jgi:hypothetical protein